MWMFSVGENCREDGFPHSGQGEDSQPEGAKSSNSPHPGQVKVNTGIRFG